MIESYPESPACPDVGIVALVPDPWESVWMPRHYVLSRLGTYFHTVWVEPAPDWREVLRSLSRQPVLPAVPDPRLPGFEIYRPPRYLPRMYRPEWAATQTLRHRLKQARARLLRQGCNKTILYLWRPEFASALNQRDLFDLSCYHIDDEYSFAEHDQPVDETERSILKSVDQVFIHSPALMEKKAHFNANTLEVPNGVDFRRFTTAVPEPADLAGIPHPRIGYVGVIKAQLDLELMSRLARSHPEWSFVLVGPIGYIGGKDKHLAALQATGNVHFLGHKPVGELPAYTQNMDVAMLCYSQTDYTNFIYPLKIHESLASGVPVVATPIRSLQAFGEVVDFASNEQDWSAALGRAVAPDSRSGTAQARRRAISQEFDWDILVCRIARELAARVGSDCFARMPDLDSVRATLDSAVAVPMAQTED